MITIPRIFILCAVVMSMLVGFTIGRMIESAVFIERVTQITCEGVR